ncbi:hypothetical protein DAPPUDRAFT_233289 [Daphnia pulex]|uniref:Uncharacterized protein n=1 Tax=Daphnia pulex TaxID=6669 RepID=E9FTQ1_DAPPU|nr:hypothetical protein DAPPUDRAFT_233289 [Daphnia pulex]|eukprot:EFX89407.1 hypothetical protein DAPPUDRAFT_233289 [Daphnia pulex]
MITQTMMLRLLLMTGQYQHKMMDEEATLTEIQSIRQKMVEAYHIQRQYKTILDVISAKGSATKVNSPTWRKAPPIPNWRPPNSRSEVREAAKRARDMAKTELQHHEETLVASTRETDRLLSDYKRRIDEMKSTASNASNRQVRNPTTPMSRVTHPAAGSTGHLSNSSAAAAAEISLATLRSDQEARQALHETKKAIDHLKSVTGAADVRSTIRIVEAQKEKCDELRQQFHVLQERVQYLSQLKETLLGRLNQLIEAQAAQSSNNSTRPTPRFLDEMFADDGSLTPHYKTASLNGEYQTGGGGQHGEDGEQMDCNEALASLASAITKICSQIPFGPPVEEANYPSESASMNDHLNVLNLLESKLSSLMELVKSLDAIKAEPSTVNGNNPTNNPDLLYSQVGQLSLPTSPRLADPAIKLMQQQTAEGGAAAAGAGGMTGAVVGSHGTAVIGTTVGRAGNPKLRGANESGSDEDQVPTRGFLKRQTRIIVDAKTKKQNQRPRKND